MPAVEATRLSVSNYPVVIHSQGTVQPTQANTLVPEVAGAITGLSADFVVGGSFRAGDVLIQIDERDYAIALTQARANLAQAEAALQEEKALGERAQADWKSLGRGGKPSSLTLREPQLAAASASLDAAAAQVERAQLDLTRTRIVAPYAGRVLERQVDVGQFVTRGSPVGRIHAVDSVDIRLPLTNRQLTWLTLPAQNAQTASVQPNVELLANIGGSEHRWTGKLVRTEGVDENTQQLNVIARVQKPYADGKQPLRVGQFVQARVAGQLLEDVFVVRREALRGDDEVLVLNSNNEVFRRRVKVAWTDEQFAAISEGLEPDAVLVLTPLSTVTDGTPVRATIDGVPPPPLEGSP
jgi:RND family efflux transporter MFP subunit